ncbi:MAG TPA: efflux RND transporter periplasmic adaptor subunit [Solimonas sp.]
MSIHHLSLSALLVSALLLSACSGTDDGAPETEAPARPVRIATVERGPALAPVVGIGIVAARDEARLSFKTGGLIREIAVRQGETVRAGQRLATLETTEIDAGVAQARAASDKAQRDLERGRQLFKDDVLTQEQLDDLGTAAAVAKAQLDAAQFNRRYSEIVAPADGRVLRRLAEPRELIAAGQPVLLVSRGAGGYTMKLGLPDRDFVQVRLGDRARLRFDAYPGREFAAQVVERGEAADPRTGTFPVELEVDAGDTALASGLIGRAEIAATGAGDAQLDYVPLSALVEGNADATLLFLYDAKTQTVQGQRVAVAFVTEHRAALREPLPAGSQVVTDGAPYLDDGARARVVE